MALSKQEKKKIVAIGLWQCHCRNREKKIVTIVAMALPKMGGEKVVPKSRESKKKVLHSQYFHNKLHVISYYQFKFEFNTKVIFLIQ